MEVIRFYPEGLLHKFGFGDGDLLLELMEEHHLAVDRSELLVAVVERLVVPRLDQDVETYTLLSSHNPIRASTVDGVEADLDSVLTPRVIEIPATEIISVARSLGTGPMTDNLDRLDLLVLGAGPGALLDEIDTSMRRGEAGPALRTLREAVVLSAGALDGDRSQLPSQLRGRLLTSGDSAVQDLVSRAEGCRVHPWLRPLTTSLTPPGGRLFGLARAHPDAVTALAFSPDGRLVASGSYYRDVRVWDTWRGTDVSRFAGERPGASHPEGAGGDAIVSLAFTDDGVKAASADRCIYAVDPVTGVGRMVVPGHTDDLFAVSLSSDGRTAVSAPRDSWGSTRHEVEVWDAVDGQLLHSLAGPGWMTAVTTVSADGAVAASAGKEGELLLWDVRRGRLWSREVRPGGCFALSPDGATLALTSGSTVVVRRRLDDPTSEFALAGRAGTVQALVFAGTERLAAGTDDGAVFVWDLSGCQLVAELPGQGAGIRSVAGSRDGRWLATGAADGSVRVWDLGRPPALSGRAARMHRGAVVEVAVGDDGTSAATKGADGEVLRWDLTTGSVVPVPGDGDTRLDGVAGRTPSAPHLRARAERLDVEESGENPGEKYTLTGVAVSADGRWALIASTHWTTVFWRLGIARDVTRVRLWDLGDGVQRRLLVEAARDLVHGGQVDAVRCVAISRDGAWGASGGDDRTARLWDLGTGDLVASFTGESAITSCALSPDGRLLVAGESSGRVHLLRLEGQP